MLTSTRNKPNKKQKIIGVTRGWFQMQVLAGLDEAGLLPRLTQDGGLRVRDTSADPIVLVATLEYLQSVGILDAVDGRWVATEDGASVLKYLPAYYILYSYKSYLDNLARMLAGEKCTVDRAQNVRGSGGGNVNFFRKLIPILARLGAIGLTDVGCGNGAFLTHAHAAAPDLELCGCDLSEVAVNISRQNLAELGRPVTLFTGNIAQPEAIERALPPSLDRGGVVVSSNHIFHEVTGKFAEGEPVKYLTKLLRRYRGLFGKGLLISELFPLSPKILAECADMLSSPEVQLVHTLSGQGLMSYDAWMNAFADAGYEVEVFHPMFEVPEHEGLFGAGVFYAKAA